MTTFHKNIASQLNSKKDKDILEFIQTESENTGSSISAIIKKSLRFYIKGRGGAENGTNIDNNEMLEKLTRLLSLKQQVKPLSNDDFIQTQQTDTKMANDNKSDENSKTTNQTSNTEDTGVDKINFGDDDNILGNFSPSDLNDIIDS